MPLTAALSPLLLIILGTIPETIYVDIGNPNCPGSGSLGDPFCRIQAAIDAAGPGDVVLVQPGTYSENIDFMGKPITLRSVSGAHVTIIDGGQLGAVVSFVSGEGPGSILDGFTVTNGSGHFDGSRNVRGGGIYCLSSSPRIIRNTVTLNKPSRPSSGYFFEGGGIWIGYSSSPEITGNTITLNSVQGLGGGIACMTGSAPTIMNNTIANNMADAGAGVDCAFLSSPKIYSNDISYNSAVFVGGGIRSFYRSSPTIANNTLSNNYAGQAGAGIGASRYSAPSITSNSISRNSSPFGLGAGVFSNYGCASSITSNSISGNYGRAGGGIWAYADIYAPTVYGNQVLGNTASLGGGGMALLGRVPASATNNTISANVALNVGGGVYQQANWALVGDFIFGNSAVYGGGVYTIGSPPSSIINCTVSANAASSGGGILAHPLSTAHITNCIVWNNSGGEVVASPGSNTVVSYSDILGGYPGPGNINADPAFVDPASGSFDIDCSSPCVDVGDDSVGNVPRFDASQSDPRRVSRIDMGADEAGLAVQFHGPALVGGAPVRFSAKATTGQSGNIALVLVSLKEQHGGGVRVPLSGGRSLGLSPDPLMSAWLSLPPSLSQVVLSGCSDAFLASFSIPASFPIGLAVYFGGLSFGPGGKTVSITGNSRFVTQ